MVNERELECLACRKRGRRTPLITVRYSRVIDQQANAVLVCPVGHSRTAQTPRPRPQREPDTELRLW